MRKAKGFEKRAPNILLFRETPMLSDAWAFFVGLTLPMQLPHKVR
jgi:hypothetical protein